MSFVSKTLLTTALCTTLLACHRSESENRHIKDANTPAGKVGQVAYEAAKESGKAAKVVGKELSKAAHEAHEGWKEAAEKDKARH
jgi:hypothetical protein